MPYAEVTYKLQLLNNPPPDQALELRLYSLEIENPPGDRTIIRAQMMVQRNSYQQSIL